MLRESEFMCPWDEPARPWNFQRKNDRNKTEEGHINARFTIEKERNIKERFLTNALLNLKFIFKIVMNIISL